MRTRVILQRARLQTAQRFANPARDALPGVDRGEAMPNSASANKKVSSPNVRSRAREARRLRRRQSPLPMLPRARASRRFALDRSRRAFAGLAMHSSRAHLRHRLSLHLQRGRRTLCQPMPLSVRAGAVAIVSRLRMAETKNNETSVQPLAINLGCTLVWADGQGLSANEGGNSRSWTRRPCILNTSF